jgi:putative transposase
MKELKMSENIIAFKTELDPNERMKVKFENYTKLSKWVYNWGIYYKNYCYKNNVKMTRFDLTNIIGKIKHHIPIETFIKSSFKDITSILLDNGFISDSNGIDIKYSEKFDIYRIYQHKYHIFNISYPSYHYISIKEPDYLWLNNYDATTINSVFQDVDSAFKNFFRRCKKGDKKKGFPKIKKYSDKFSVSYQGTKISDDRRNILLGSKKHFGWIRVKEKNYLPKIKEGCDIQSVTISRECDRWFISIQVPTDRIESKLISGNNSNKFNIKLCSYAGLDLNTNIESRLTYCDPDKEYHFIGVPNRFFNKHEKNLKRWQRKLSRCIGSKKGEKWSNRFKKTNIHVSKCHAKIRRSRHYFAQQFASEISNRIPILVIEDLDNKEMIEKKMVDKNGKKLKNKLQHKKNRAQTDAGFGIIKQCLTQQYTKKKMVLACVPKMFPSTQICCICGNQKVGKDKIPIEEKIYICSKCGSKMNRDGNSSHNLMTVAAVLAETLNARNARGVDISKEETIEIKYFDQIIPLKILSVKRIPKREVLSSESKTMDSSEIPEHNLSSPSAARDLSSLAAPS